MTIQNKTENGPSGNRTRVLGFEAQEDVLYPMDPSHLFISKDIKYFLPIN